MNPQIHVGGDVTENGIRMAGSVIEQLDGGVHGSFGAVGLGTIFQNGYREFF